ncbi:TetR/AcrR family transcriptional regulator [Nocardia sp. NPDC052254]|uniref:TetR/AcrR family transcriptional regulator n=1 Tax=Nocardia sp. NPDC052254 TaxID=3155681 RepID=UPI00343E6EE7
MMPVTSGAELPMSTESMTAGQLGRRRRLADAVIEMLEQTEPDRIKMKDVSQRSEVALGTLYRYFPAKQQLLAAAMQEWNNRLLHKLDTERAAPRVADGATVCERVLALHRREMRAYQRGPHFARLEIELYSSTDEYVIETLDQRAAANRAALFDLMDGVPPELARVASLAIGGTMLTALALWTSGRISFAEALRNVEDVIRLVLPEE